MHVKLCLISSSRSHWTGAVYFLKTTVVKWRCCPKTTQESEM